MTPLWRTLQRDGRRGYHTPSQGDTTGMDVTELIRRGYAALGLGTHPDVLAMFD